MLTAHLFFRLDGVQKFFLSPLSVSFLIYFVLLVALSCICYWRNSKEFDTWVYWTMGLTLTIFTAFRPMGIAIDDLNYIHTAKDVCALTECLTVGNVSRDWLWYALVALLKSAVNGEQSVLFIAALGLIAQLWVINRLCQHKVMALTLFTPLVYLLFDFTIFRAGLALSLYFCAIYFLTHKHSILGGGLLIANFTAHSQAIFSIGLLPSYLIMRHKKVALIIATFALAGIYLQITPTTQFLSIFIKGAAQVYVDHAKNGGFIGEKLFPTIYLLLLAYLGVILVFRRRLLIDTPVSNAVSRYVLASVLLALILAWLFAPIQVIQSRLLEFYFAPIVLLAGNLERNRWTFIGTIALAIMIYARMELIHNFILG